jgi:hypothetical protein
MRIVLTLGLALAGLCGVCAAQDQIDDPLLRLQQRLDAQEDELRLLRQRLDRQDLPWGTSLADDADLCAPANLRRVPLAAEEPFEPACDETGDGPAFRKLNFYTDYDHGFVIRPFDPERHPFELKVNGWIQFRHHGFARDVTSWTDNAGVTRPVRDRNAFDIERGRLLFSGFAIDQRLTYFLHLDGDSDGSEMVDFFDYWWAWQFTERFKLQMGKRKVPGGRQWLLTARHTRFVDRPMATDFLRPDRTLGIFGMGQIGETGQYEVMVGNGYRTANLSNDQTDNRFTFAVTNFFDPLGDYGEQIVDFEHTREPLVRLGHSFVYSPQAAADDGDLLPEADFVRLTDGTRLTQTGALAPGVTVTTFDATFYGLDGAVKWNGWSLNAEVHLRWIDQIAGTGPLPVRKLFQRGWYLEGGYFLIPGKLDANLRYSQVSGGYGNAAEYAAGVNWYPLGKPTMKVSFDVTSLDGSPLQNTTSDILVGDKGTLFRTQFQAEF